MSLRFDNLIRGSMTVREIRQQHPATAEVMENYGFRASCDDCTIDVLCRKYGLSMPEVVETLNKAAFPHQ